MKSAIPNPQSRPGFTLLELLVVIAILGVVGAVVAACLAGGIRAWDRARKFSAGEPQALLGLTMIEKDLMNSFQYSGIRFDVSRLEVSFSGLVTGESDGNGTERKIGTIRYFVGQDAKAKALFRQQWPYPEDKPSEEYAERIISGVKDMEFSCYCLPDPAETEGDNDKVTNFPDVVEIGLVLVEDLGSVDLKRTVLLPVRSVQ